MIKKKILIINLLADFSIKEKQLICNKLMTTKQLVI